MDDGPPRQGNSTFGFDYRLNIHVYTTFVCTNIVFTPFAAAKKALNFC
jgi:hypothetical protein